MNRQKMDNITVIQEATVPLAPEKPNKRKIALMGLLLGACLGIGSAFFFEYVRQGLSTPESAEKRLGLPVLSTFPYKK
jgi:capsular polysaccharide biosynthesis protein